MAKLEQSYSLKIAIYLVYQHHQLLIVISHSYQLSKSLSVLAIIIIKYPYLPASHLVSIYMPLEVAALSRIAIIMKVANGYFRHIKNSSAVY